MSAARWSLRLPRAASTLSQAGALHGRVDRRLPRALAPSSHRRWLQKPPRRERPWTSRREEAKKDESQDDGHAGSTQGGGVEAQRQQAHASEQQPGRNAQLAAALAESDSSDLVTEVRIPHDPNGILPPDHPALSVLGNSSLVIQRQIEMWNLVIGMEQANKYVIMDGQGQTLGYIAEKDHGIGSTFARQMFKTHRSFTTHIFDRQEREVLRIHRPFAYINSRIRIYDPVPEGGYADLETSTALQGTSPNSALNQGALSQVSPLKLEEMRIIGEAQQRWAPLRRKYDLFSYRPLEAPRDENLRVESGEKPTSDTMALTESNAPNQAIEAGMVQFAHVNEPFLSWDFTLKSEDQNTIGSVNRNFVGFARELFTDTGVYALRMDSAAQTSALQDASGHEVARYEREAAAMTLDQRAVMLATAVSIDFDYFSRHSTVGGGGFMPIFWPMGGGAAEGGAVGAGAGVAGSAAEGAGAVEGAAGAAGRGLGGAAGAGGEGAIAGAGTMAGYEAMQRGAQAQRGGDDASPTNSEPFGGAQSPEQGENRPGDDVWGESDDPWGRGGPGDGPPSDGPPPGMGGEGGDGGGGGGGGGWADVISDFFGD